MASPPYTNSALTTAFSTTALLDDGKIFDSGILSLMTHTQVQTEVSASHDGLMTFNFYSDIAGSDLVRSIEVPYVAASGFQLLAAPTFGSYVRYQFTNNSGSAQTDFYYATKLLHTALSAQILSLGGKATNSMTSSLIRIGNDHNLDLSRGLLINESVIHKFGANSNVGTTEVYLAINNLIGMPAAPSVVTAVSDSAEDTNLTGDGAYTVEITGLDTSFNEVSETLTMNGLTSSTASVNSYWRVYRARVLTCGLVRQSNVGTITIEYAAEDALDVGPQAGSSETTHFVVPAGKTGYITRLHTSVDGKKTADISFWLQPDFNDVSSPFPARRLLSKIIGLSGSDEVLFDSYLVCPEMSEIYMTCLAAASNTGVNAHYDIILVDN